MKNSLLKRIGIVNFCLALIISALVVGIGISLTEDSVRKNVQEVNTLFADSVSGHIECKMNLAKLGIETLAISGAPITSKTVDQFNGTFDALFYFNQDGKLAAIFDNKKEIQKNIIDETEIYQNKNQGLIIKDSKIIFLARSKLNGNIIGGLIDVQKNKPIQDLMEVRLMKKHGMIIVLDKDNKVVYKSDKNLKDYSTYVKEAKKGKYISGNVELKVTKWKIAYITEDSMQFSYLFTQKATMLLTLGGEAVILVFVISTMVLRKMITEPIDMLVRKVNEVEFGRYEPIDVKVQGEIGIIVAAFNKMILRLKHSYEKEKVNQKRISQAEKVNVIGELAAATSHEIRNPLTTVKGFTQLLQKKLPKDSNDVNYTKVILKEIANMENIVKEFLLLARPTCPELVRENVNHILDDVLPDLAHKVVDKNNSIVTNFSEDISFTYLDREQIKQLFINIGLYAIDNACYGEKLYIRTLIEMENINIDFKCKTTGSIYDVDGLSMATNYQIVHNHNGTLMIKTEDGYAIYSITLPIAT